MYHKFIFKTKQPTRKIIHSIVYIHLTEDDDDCKERIFSQENVWSMENIKVIRCFYGLYIRARFNSEKLLSNTISCSSGHMGLIADRNCSIDVMYLAEFVLHFVVCRMLSFSINTLLSKDM